MLFLSKLVLFYLFVNLKFYLWMIEFSSDFVFSTLIREGYVKWRNASDVICDNKVLLNLKDFFITTIRFTIQYCMELSVGL
jgi:hypothetical protein